MPCAPPVLLTGISSYPGMFSTNPFSHRAPARSKHLENQHEKQLVLRSKSSKSCQ